MLARVLKAILKAALILGSILAGVGLWARPATPDSFYDPPAKVPASAGQPIAHEPFTRGMPGGKRARLAH